MKCIFSSEVSERRISWAIENQQVAEWSTYALTDWSNRRLTKINYVINQQIPVFQNFEHTPMILIFFVTVLVIQVALIVGIVLQIEPVSDIQYIQYRLCGIESIL